MPGTDAVPYVCALTPGVVNHPPAPVARAKTLLRRTLLRTFSRVCLKGCSNRFTVALAHMWGVPLRSGLSSH